VPIEPLAMLALEFGRFLRVTFTIGAIGTGLAIPSLWLRSLKEKNAPA
jgi:hypothetical protein